MSKIRLDRVIVFDLELTCWATKEEQASRRSEIIEIGACLLDIKTGDINNKTRYIIRPYKLKQRIWDGTLNISQYCTDLTGHTIETLKAGIPFGDACNKFKKEFGTSNKICAGYGEDYGGLDTECIRFGITNPLSGSYINICHLFALKNKSSEVSLEQALEKIGDEFEGTQHRADDDAYNAAKILRSILV